jgi:hypothetical protein
LSVGYKDNRKKHLGWNDYNSFDQNAAWKQLVTGSNKDPFWSDKSSQLGSFTTSKPIIYRKNGEDYVYSNRHNDFISKEECFKHYSRQDGIDPSQNVLRD